MAIRFGTLAMRLEALAMRLKALAMRWRTFPARFWAFRVSETSLARRAPGFGDKVRILGDEAQSLVIRVDNLAE